MEKDQIFNHYNEQLEKFENELKNLKKRRSSFAWLRLGSIAALFFSFYLLWQAGVIFVIAAAAILLFVFIRLVYADLENHEKINFTNKIIELYRDEIDSLNNILSFENGTRYLDKEHPYSADLDIFGSGSLFQYLNRTTSEPGADKLASYLLDKASIDVINKRQICIRELAKDPEWIKKLQTAGALNRYTNKSNVKLEKWIHLENNFLQFRPWLWLRFLLPLAALVVVILYMADTAGLITLLSALAVMAVIAWQINKAVAPVHRQLDETARELGSLSKAIEMIEMKEFHSPLLKEIRQNLVTDNSRASDEIKKIKKLLDRLDLRYNIVLSLPLNLLLLWNLQQILDLEKWKVKHKDQLKSWTDALAETEALCSLANFSFNHPSYIFPEVVPDYFLLEGMEIGHPLIPAGKRVSNPVHLPSEGKLMLVTGSNMAGKSTYLRSIGVNCILAFCGAPVSASSFRISLVSVITSMRIADNLQESTSTFYAELKKLKVIIDKVNHHDKVLILLDEILRGTNSHDRHTGSKALIRQLIEKRSAGIVATHDLELAEMNESFAGNLLNYHFDVQVSNEELYFDYKLKPGICRSMNASILMKKIGIEIGER